MNPGFFITGTDTAVGKTLTSVALLQTLAKQGLNTAAIKPIASGCDETPQGRRNEDALALQQAMTLTCPYEWINPIALSLPVIPHVAAAAENKTLDLSTLKQASQPILTHEEVDVVVVEGSGGWHSVPFNAHVSLVDYVRWLQYPVMLVVGMRLGCVNHALLTVEAIHAAGLTLAGWIANTMQDPMPKLEENIATLKTHINAPLLGRFPAWQTIPDDLSGYLTLNDLFGDAD